MKFIKIFIISTLLGGCSCIKPNCEKINIFTSDVNVKDNIRLHLYTTEDRCAAGDSDKCLKELVQDDLQVLANEIFNNTDIEITVNVWDCVDGERCLHERLPNSSNNRGVTLADYANVHTCFNTAIADPTGDGRRKLASLGRWNEEFTPKNGTDIFGYILGDYLIGDSNQALGDVIRSNRNGFVTYLPATNHGFYLDYMTNPHKPNLERMIFHELGHTFNLDEMHIMNHGSSACNGKCSNSAEAASIMNQIGAEGGISLKQKTCLEYSYSSEKFLNSWALLNLPMYGEPWNSAHSHNFCSSPLKLVQMNLASQQTNANNGQYSYNINKYLHKKYEQVYLNVSASLSPFLAHYVKNQIQNGTESIFLELNMNITQSDLPDQPFLFTLFQDEFDFEGNIINFVLPIATSDVANNQLDISDPNRGWIIYEEGMEYSVQIDSLSIAGQSLVSGADQQPIKVAIAYGVIDNDIENIKSELAYIANGLRYEEFDREKAQRLFSIIDDSTYFDREIKLQYKNNLIVALETLPLNVCTLPLETIEQQIQEDSQYSEYLRENFYVE